jgi:putative FmdB family regulatory protein
MPLYEYECRQCGRRVEKIQKFSDPELTVCPHCAGALERTVTAAAVSFKGGGWYKDLYSSAKPAASKSESSTGDSGNGATSSSSAPAAAGAGSPGTASSTASSSAASTASSPAASSTSSSSTGS